MVWQYLNILTEGFWERELYTVIDWDTVWGNCFDTSKNPTHQMIDYKFICKAYVTPCLLYIMKRKSDPFCHLSSSLSQNTCICSRTVPELCCSGPWYRTYCRIFWRLRSIRIHCFSCWRIHHWHCLSIKKWFCLLLLLLLKRLFWKCGLMLLPQLGLLGCHMHLLDIVHCLLVIQIILFCNIVLFVSSPPPPYFLWPDLRVCSK